MTSFMSFAVDRAMTTKKQTGQPTQNREKIGGVNIDRQRMDKALAGPTFVLPIGLSEEEMIAHICGSAKKHK